VTNQQLPPAVDAREFLLAEYGALRDELLRRVEIRYQLVLAALVGAGTFLSLGVQFKAAAVVLLFPVLVALLAASWASNDVAIKRIAAYIGSRIETAVGDGTGGWEHTHPHARITGPFASVVAYATRGVFVVTQLVALIVGIVIAYPIEQPALVALAAVDLLVVALTTAMLGGYRVTFES
jgi:hypothetical protein